MILSVQVEQELLSEDCLRQWLPLTLEQRCIRIKQLYDASVKPWRLHYFYKRNGVVWRATSKNFVAQARRLPQLEAQRQEFALMLIKLICDGVPVMYFDETSFQLEMTMRKAFYTRQNKLVMPIPRG